MKTVHNVCYIGCIHIVLLRTWMLNEIFVLHTDTSVTDNGALLAMAAQARLKQH